MACLLKLYVNINRNYIHIKKKVVIRQWMTCGCQFLMSKLVLHFQNLNTKNKKSTYQKHMH